MDRSAPVSTQRVESVTAGKYCLRPPYLERPGLGGGAGEELVAVHGVGETALLQALQLIILRNLQDVSNILVIQSHNDLFLLERFGDLDIEVRDDRGEVVEDVGVGGIAGHLELDSPGGGGGGEGKQDVEDEGQAHPEVRRGLTGQQPSECSDAGDKGENLVKLVILALATQG